MFLTDGYITCAVDPPEATAHLWVGVGISAVGARRHGRRGQTKGQEGQKCLTVEWESHDRSSYSKDMEVSKMDLKVL